MYPGHTGITKRNILRRSIDYEKITSVLLASALLVLLLQAAAATTTTLLTLVTKLTQATLLQLQTPVPLLKLQRLA